MRKEMIAVMVISAIMFTTTGIAAATEEDPIKIYGTITDAYGNPVVGGIVEIKKDNGGNWHSIGGSKITDVNGEYSTGYVVLVIPMVHNFGDRNDNYQMWLDGKLVATKTIGDSNWICDPVLGRCGINFSYQWDYSIPEFSTIALPIISVIGLLFVLQNKKNKT